MRVHRPVDGKQTRRLIREGRDPRRYTTTVPESTPACWHARTWATPPTIMRTPSIRQVDMHATVAEVCGLASEQVIIGVDGCGLAVFGVPVANMAYACARLAEPVPCPPFP